jgi:hypothetical protein
MEARDEGKKGVSLSLSLSSLSLSSGEKRRRSNLLQRRRIRGDKYIQHRHAYILFIHQRFSESAPPHQREQTDAHNKKKKKPAKQRWFSFLFSFFPLLSFSSLSSSKWKVGNSGIDGVSSPQQKRRSLDVCKLQKEGNFEEKKRNERGEEREQGGKRERDLDMEARSERDTERFACCQWIDERASSARRRERIHGVRSAMNGTKSAISAQKQVEVRSRRRRRSTKKKKTKKKTKKKKKKTKKKTKKKKKTTTKKTTIANSKFEI